MARYVIKERITDRPTQGAVWIWMANYYDAASSVRGKAGVLCATSGTDLKWG